MLELFKRNPGMNDVIPLESHRMKRFKSSSSSFMSKVCWNADCQNGEKRIPFGAERFSVMILPLLNLFTTVF